MTHDGQLDAALADAKRIAGALTDLTAAVAAHAADVEAVKRTKPVCSLLDALRRAAGFGYTPVFEGEARADAGASVTVAFSSHADAGKFFDALFVMFQTLRFEAQKAEATSPADVIHDFMRN